MIVVKRKEMSTIFVIASPKVIACLKYEKGESGEIQSPNYPSPYNANANCRWVIEGPINSRIHVRCCKTNTIVMQIIIIISL